MNTIKKLTILSGLIASISATAIQAVPLYYTFEGEVEHISNLSNSPPPLSLGDHVSYIFLVDDQVTGPINSSSSTNYGVEHESSVRADDYSYRFYTELVSATGLTIDEDRTGENTNGHFYGFASYSTNPTSYYFNNPGNPSAFIGGNGSNGGLEMDLNLRIPRTNIESLADISQWISENDITSNMNDLHLRDDEGNVSSRIQSSLHLTSISAASSVPEPSTYLLMGLGLIGIGARRLKQYLS